ncbi:MAG: glucosamine-6-phosphate deaminase [Mollicutes bacterium]|nr:glucosamine-6-phosphate deaminase [Mollicutes bacterium]MDD7264108.1 glucosamine-6-phosphate deaminase [bacterium]MDY4979179.1 glucosamine-6-phosphate deaminase [Candidatus Onthovivens sp.]
MEVIILDNKIDIGLAIAKEIIKDIKNNPKLNLGLATGSSPLPLYKSLIELSKLENISFKDITTFNLDEYCGLSNDNKESYHYFMNENLFKYLDFSKDSHYFPSIDNVNNYDEIINNHGGIDIQILGIGANGHIAFNEPNTPISSVTHITNLANKTILDNSRFFSNIDEVPTQAITMGLSTILKAKKIYLIATGKNKAEAISIMLKGKYIKECPASALNLKKDNVYIYLDKDAASLISK